MNLILLSKRDFINNSNIVCLKKRRYNHISSVNRAKVGDVLMVGLENNKIGEGKVILIDDEKVEMEIALKCIPPKPLDVILILALPRPIVLKRVLSAVSSLGVKRICLINAWRVEKSYWNSSILDFKKIREQLILGLEQAKDTIIPSVTFHKLFKLFVKNELPNIIKDKSCFVAHPNLRIIKKYDISTPAVVAVGPEGGFIDKEVDTFVEYGFNVMDLGQRILRVETAIPIVLSKFN